MIGVLFALIWVIEPLWTTLLAIPGAVIARALQYIRQLERETRSAVDSLAQVVDDRDTLDVPPLGPGRRATPSRSPSELDLDEELIELIEQAASVHDLGKIGVPDRVLLKPGPLTADEQTTMWLHTEIGARILRQFHLFRSGAEIVLHHHEAFDGSGYPTGPGRRGDPARRPGGGRRRRPRRDDLRPAVSRRAVARRDDRAVPGRRRAPVGSGASSTPR